MTAYLGFDVLDQVIPSRPRDAIDDTLVRKSSVLDPGTGQRSGDELAAVGNPSKPFAWPCFSRAKVAELRAFLDARRGRVVPCWVPSWQQDLTLAADAANGATSLTLRWAGYARHLYPLGGARRHLALWSPGQPLMLRKVNSATDPGDLVTESVGLASATDRACPAAGTLVMFLRLVRLDEDLARIRWLSRDVAEAELVFRDLPQEAPA